MPVTQALFIGVVNLQPSLSRLPAQMSGEATALHPQHDNRATPVKYAALRSMRSTSLTCQTGGDQADQAFSLQALF